MDLSGSPSQSPVLPRRKPTSPAPKSNTSSQKPTRKTLGRYLITGQLGRGGMGIVYEAEDSLLKRKVAIKLLPREVSSDPEALSRFLREAQAAAKLNHANVVAVYDLGQSDGKHFIVMELMNGGSAQEIVRNQGHFHWAEATNVLMDVCRGVAAAHKAGLIHRDIKPANILRTTDGIVKLADFGLVKPTGIKGTGDTGLGEVVGTPYYMSPEQSRSDTIDKRSDIYSLGATYFALLTGRPPFNSPDSMQVLFAHCGTPVPDPRDFVSDIPEQCVAIIRKAMEKQRTNRYRSAGEMLRDLERVQPSLPSASSTARIEKPIQPVIWKVLNHADTTNCLSLADAYPAELTEVIEPESKRFRWVPFLVLGLGLLLVAISIAIFARNPKRSESEAVPVQVPIETPRQPIFPTPEKAIQPKPIVKPKPVALNPDDWPTQSAEADRVIRTHDLAGMKRTSGTIQILQKQPKHAEPTIQNAIQQTLQRLEKAITFRESITEKGLVLGFDGQVTNLQFSPDDRLLAVGQSHGDAGAFIFDTQTGEKRYTLWPRSGTTIKRVQAMSFDHTNSTLAAITLDNRIELSHFVSGKESSFAFAPGVRRALALAFSPTKGDLVAGFEAFGEGKGKPYLNAWNLETKKAPFVFKSEHSAKVSAVAFCAGGHQVATGSDDKRVVIWNAETGRIWRELRTGINIRALACSSTGRLLVVSGMDQQTPVIQFWDYAAERKIASIQSPSGSCNSLAFSRDGNLLASGNGTKVMLWNPETQQIIATLIGHNYDVNSVAFSAEGGILASGSNDQTTRLWDVNRYLPAQP
jgi:WD40 repeat protein